MRKQTNTHKNQIPNSKQISGIYKIHKGRNREPNRKIRGGKNLERKRYIKQISNNNKYVKVYLIGHWENANHNSLLK